MITKHSPIIKIVYNYSLKHEGLSHRGRLVDRGGAGGGGVGCGGGGEAHGAGGGGRREAGVGVGLLLLLREVRGGGGGACRGGDGMEVVSE